MTRARYTTCNLCASDKTPALLFVKDSLRVVKCRECGFIYVNPRPPREEAVKTYGVGYFNGSRDADFLGERDLYIERFREKMKALSRYASKGTLLDVGCATGYFLEVAQERGWQVFGTDVSSFAGRLAREKGFDVFCGTVEEAGYPACRFDAVTLWHVLEHMEDPLGSLQEIHRITKTGAVIAIEVPNAGSRSFRKEGADWEYLKPRAHLSYFTPETLEKMVEKAGFSATRLEVLPSGTGLGQGLKRTGHERLKKQLIASFGSIRWIRRGVFILKKALGADDFILLFARRIGR